MHTSRHDTYQIKDFLNLYKCDAEQKSTKPLQFRLVCTDYSFAEMHAIIQSFNIETINDYSDRVYKYCTENINFNDTLKSWIISCVSHTMHRFSKGVNKLFSKNKVLCRFLCFTFSLMLNCDNLNHLTTIFSNICIIFKSKTKSQQFENSYSSILNLIEDRDVQMEDDDFENEKYELKSYAKIKSVESIKEHSKFGKHFRQVESNLKLEDKGSEDNEFFHPKYIKFLQDYFMPYCFIWSGLVLKGLNITRVNNGSLEKV